MTAKAAKVDPGLKALGLTPRMIDVLALLLRGYSNKVIARYLGISPHTVTDHVSTILGRLAMKRWRSSATSIGSCRLIPSVFDRQRPFRRPAQS